MSIKKWTPLQEGRFHLRNKLPNERWRTYVAKAYPALTGVQLSRKVEAVLSLVQLARKERDQALRARARQMKTITSGSEWISPRPRHVHL